MYCSLGELNAMEPNDIENISILKDASAAIYGARSSHGVVLVTTKKASKVRYRFLITVHSAPLLME